MRPLSFAESPQTASLNKLPRHFPVRLVAWLLLVALLSGNARSTFADSDLSIPASNDEMPGAGPVRRAEWFQNVWNSRRAEFAKSTSGEKGAVVFLGDSITQGWGDQLAKHFPGVLIANRGISGDTTRGMLYRLPVDVLALEPSAVVLLMGTNDLEEMAEPQTIADNVRLIIAALKKHNPRVPIVLCSTFPSSASKKRPADKIKELNRLYAAAVKGDSQITVVDTWTLFANAEGDAKPELFPDLLHLNEAAYAQWAAALRPILATLGFLETEADPFVVEEGFTSLFNGRDLTGWGFLPSSEEDKKSRERWQKSDPNAAAWPIIDQAVAFTGLKESSDGRYVAKNGRLIVMTPSEGRRIQQLWTTEVFPRDFELRLEFRATPNADSGIFLRKPQLQCRDYLVAGPYKDLKNYKPQDWNEVVIRVSAGVAHCTCNGEVLEAEFKVPATGPIGLEGDRGQMEYRRIRIRQQD